MTGRRSLTSFDLAQSIGRLDTLPPRTVARLWCLLLRAHAEEIVDRIPTSLISRTYSGQVRGRAWCLLGDPNLTDDGRRAREATVRGLIAAYRETSDVLHGRRISLSPEPLELDRWRGQVAAACELVRAAGARCDFCDTAESDFR